MSEVTTKPVIVGIDGSDQAQYAAVWAVEEALRRHAVLKLIYVVRTDLTGTLSASEYEADVDSAKAALAAARTAIAKRNPSVVVETSIAEGSPAGVLLAESPDAADLHRIVRDSRISRAILGSTAASVAEEAACAVVVVRGAESTVAQHDPLRWIVVPVTRHTEGNRTVITEAIAEARYRRWPMLAVGTHSSHGDNATSDELDRLVADWQRQFPDVHVYPISCDTDMAQFLRNSPPDINGLVVLDAGRSTELAQIIGGVTHAHRADLAVLVARENADVRVTHAPARHR